MRTSRTDQVSAGTDATASATTSYTYDLADQLTSVKTGPRTLVSNTWSRDGAITSTTSPAGTRTQTTNLAGDVTGMGLVDGTQVTYSYDPNGNRTAELVAGQVAAKWAWDESSGLATRVGQYDATGAVTSTWLPDPVNPGTAVQGATSGVSRWLLTDPFANVVAGQDTGASTVQAVWAQSDEFGATDPAATATGSSATVAGLGFAGQYLDTYTGLYDVRARDYDPTTGQFTTTDPLTPPAGTTYLSPYAYAANNPLVFLDVTGAAPQPNLVKTDWNEFWTYTGEPALRTYAVLALPPLALTPIVDLDDENGQNVIVNAMQSYAVGSYNGTIGWIPGLEAADPNACNSIYASSGSIGKWAGPQLLLYANPAGSGLKATSEAALAAKSVPAATVRFSQSSVNGAAEIEASMSAKGWVGEAIDVVRMPDGGLTSLDNTRLLAANRAGIDVQASIRGFDEALPSSLVGRFTTTKGGVPSTWGDAVMNRIGNQSGGYRTANPFGSWVTGWSGN